MARNLFNNPGFETGNLISWDTSVAGASTITVEGVEAFAGLSGVKLTIDGSNSYAAITQGPSDSIQPGQEYTISFWAKADANCTIEVIGAVKHNTAQSITTEWKKYSWTGIASDTYAYSGMKRSSATNRTIYVDNFRLEPTPIKYAVMTLPLSNDIASPNTDFFIEGFGTPKAAIVMMSAASTQSNPTIHAAQSIGFLTGYDSVLCAAGGSQGGQGTSSTYRSLPTSTVAKILYTSSTVCDYDANTVTGSGITMTMATDNTDNNRYATVIMITGHDVQADNAVFNPSNGSLITGVGFKPNALLTCGAGVPFGNTNQTNNIWSFGAAKQRPTLQNRSLNVYDQPGTSTMNCTTLVDQEEMSLQLTNSISWSSDFWAFNADGFAQGVTSSTGGDYVGYLALKMPGINMDIHTINIPGYTGNVAVSGVGFKPGLLIGCLGGSASADTISDHITISFGASDGTTEGSYGVFSVDNVNTSECGSKYSTTLFNRPNPSGSDYTTGTVNSFDEDGYTINWTNIGESASGIYGFVIAFQDPDDANKLIGNTSGKIYFKQ